MKKEVDGSLIPNSQKLSPTMEQIRERCDAIQDTWDRKTERRRRAYSRTWEVPTLHAPLSKDGTPMDWLLSDADALTDDWL